MSRAIQYRSFGGPDVLEMASTAGSAPGDGDVRIAVKAVGLNPVDEKIFGGDARLKLVGSVRNLLRPGQWFAARFPRGVARDFAGVIDAVGRGVTEFAPGDAVLGTIRSAPGLGTTQGSLAETLITPAGDIVGLPGQLSFEIAGALGVAAQTACGALRTLDVRSTDVVVISAAAGGVGSLAVQLAAHRGATVIGIAGRHNADYLRSLGAIPVTHGAGVRARIVAAAPGPVTKLLDCYGGDYVGLGFSLGLRGRAIGTLVPSPGAILRGARFTGSRHARPGDLAQVAELVAGGALTITIARTVPFDLEAVRDAYTELARGHVRGKLVVSMV